MRINWFSPLPPAKTDIAHFTTRLLPALTSAADVTLWTDQPTWVRELERRVEVRRFRTDRLHFPDLNRADLNIFNIGNNPLFHGGIWQVSRALSGVVILHDFRLHHFFDGIFRVKRRDLNAYLAVMKKYYGEAGRRDAAICFQQDARNIDQMADRYPLTEFALENSLGVIVHTREAFAQLSNEGARPVAYAPLPFPTRHSPPSKGDAASTYRLIVFGYIGRSRRLESILRALANSEYKKRYRLDVFGSVLNDEKQLGGLVGSLGLDKQVMFHGYQAEVELDKALSQSHLALNLRYPTMGEASGSQLRIWSHSLPSLVSRVGWYATLPEDTVGFVRTGEHEVLDLEAHLRAFVEEPDRYSMMGVTGQRVLATQHSPEAYVNTVVDFAAVAQTFSAKLAVFDLAERSARLVNQYLPPAVRDDVFHRTAKEIHMLVECQNADRN